jgi:hypothetical protein
VEAGKARSFLTRIEQYRSRTQFIMEHTIIGTVYFNILLTLSVLSCFQYIYSTYPSSDPSLPQLFSKLELCLASLFLFDWCLSFFVAEQKVAFSSLMQ